jgi:hypothetical protein
MNTPMPSRIEEILRNPPSKEGERAGLFGRIDHKKWCEQLLSAFKQEAHEKMPKETGHCDTPIVNLPEFITHEMALDVQDPNLEGQLYREGSSERCGQCLSCVTDIIVKQAHEGIESL